MDLTVLSRKISSYRTPKGRITKLPNVVDSLLALSGRAEKLY
jgi:hypothetical protein